MQKSINTIFSQAVKNQASDIYFLPRKDGYLISFYAQGIQFEYCQLPYEKGQKLINYLKFQGNMSLSERRRPQLGAWTFPGEEGKESIHCRLSSVGDYLGRESLVVRLLYKEEKIDRPYFFQDQWERLERACHKRGLVLFSGPMGTGKTTIMYHFARQLKGKMVMTIEDPVEIQEENFLQIQVNEQAKMTYSSLLKVALRHHPDVFIIGEIRDCLTAKMAVNAALSGHLVLSTVHAKNVYGVRQRLFSLGLEKEEVDQAISMISYQRLIPTLEGGSRILFDQLDLTVKKPRREKGMTREWGERLERCYCQGWITEKTKQRYKNG